MLDEAFALAAYNGRLEALADLLARGAAVDGVLHLGLTGLHLAVIRRRVDVATWLVAHGAGWIRDQIHHGTPAGWAAHNAAGAPIDAYLQRDPAGVTCRAANSPSWATAFHAVHGILRGRPHPTIDPQVQTRPRAG